MAGYRNFQRDNFKYKNKLSRTDIYNPEFNSSVKAIGDKELRGFKANLHKWIRFIQWARWYPDLWWDLISPPNCPIRLDLDQRIFLRVIARFFSVYGVFPRGYGKTLKEVMGMYHAAVFYPGVLLAMTAQTKENAAKILKEKHEEITTAFPLIQNEILKANFQKDSAEIYFQNGSKIDVLANQQSTKGARRRRLNVEEAALLNNELFQDVLEPIVNVPRRTAGPRALVDPEELNGQINFFTTSGFRGSDEYERNLKMLEDMIHLRGKFVFGASWELAAHFGRGETRQQILEKKERLSPIYFAQNYESKWVGAKDGALVPIQKVLELRTLSRPELEGDGKSEYVIAVDVARSESTNNNQCSIAVLKIKRGKDNRISKVQLVNLMNFPNNLNFNAQAVIVKRIKLRYDPVAVVVDGNGLGVGLVDELLRDTIDPDTGESLGCWATINTDKEPELPNAERILYDLKAQGINHEIIVNFINMVESGKLQLLEKRTDAGYDVDDVDYFNNNILPHIQTDLLIEEIANLKVKVNQHGKYTLEKIVKRIDKDRYSALAYGLYYIKTYLDDYNARPGVKATDFFFVN